MKKIGTLILVAILIATIVALGVFSSGFTNWDVNTWFKGDTAGDSVANVNRQAAFVQNDNDIMDNDVSLMTDYGSYLDSNFHSVFVQYTKTPVPSSSSYTYVFTPDVVDGYTFVGFIAYSGGAGEYLVPVPKDSNGIYSIVWGAMYEKSKGVYEEVVELLPLPPNPVREGYTFNGWYTDEACTIKYNGEGITADTQLYAGWTINKYTVTFKTEGGTACETLIVPYNTVIVDLPTTTKVGHNFVGWLINGEEYANKPITGHIELTAKWDKIIFTVNFIVNGEIYKTMEVEYGTSFDVALEKANLKNYTVLGAKFDSGENADNIIGDGIIEIREKTFVETLQSNWLNIAVYCGLAIVVLAVLVTLFKKFA